MFDLYIKDFKISAPLSKQYALVEKAIGRELSPAERAMWAVHILTSLPEKQPVHDIGIAKINKVLAA